MGLRWEVGSMQDSKRGCQRECQNKQGSGQPGEGAGDARSRWVHSSVPFLETTTTVSHHAKASPWPFHHSTRPWMAGVYHSNLSVYRLTRSTVNDLVTLSAQTDVGLFRAGILELEQVFSHAQ